MNTTKRFVIMCIVISMVLCGFSIPAYAVLEGSPYSDAYMPVCPKYSTAGRLPYGENTIVIYYKSNNSSTHLWFFLDKGNNRIIQNYYADFVNEYSGFFFDHVGYNSNYDRCKMYSLSPIIMVSAYYVSDAWTIYSSTVGAVDDSFNVSASNNGQVRYKYITDNTFLKTNRTIICSCGQYYMGNTIDNLCDTYPSSWGAKSQYDIQYYVAEYPDTIKQAIESITEVEGLMENYYNGLQDTLDTLAGNIARMHNDIGDIQDSLSNQSNEIQSAVSANQSAVSSAAAENSSVVGQAASDIINAGDGSTINSDMSEVNGIVSKLNQWNSELDSFANGMDDSISGVANALDNGKALFEGFVGAAPIALSALIAFALIWFVVRKIIGR